jgi:hypothetical protein
LTIIGSVNEFPKSESTKMRKSVSFVSLSREKNEIETLGLLSNPAVTVVSMPDISGG